MLLPSQTTLIISTSAIRIRVKKIEQISENLAIEIPLEIRLNGYPYTTIMVYPTHLKELALGFCLSEGLVTNINEILGISLGSVQTKNRKIFCWVNLKMPLNLIYKIKRIQTQSKNISKIQNICNKKETLTIKKPLTNIINILYLLENMKKIQITFGITGATHTAALATPTGQLISIAEDIGRHNAFDKAIGLAFLGGHNPSHCLMAISSRLNYEIALKAIRTNIPLVASLSAPTSLSRLLMNKLGITMVAFGRTPRVTIYTHPQRIIVNEYQLNWNKKIATGKNPAAKINKYKKLKN